MLETEKCALVLIDIQGKLAQLMDKKEILFANIKTLIESAKLLEIPIICCQQSPAALGPTIEEIAQLITDIEPVNKDCFSCALSEEFNRKLNSLDKKQIILCGIEAHICVYQTAADLLGQGKDVTVVSDAVSSRTEQNRQIAVEAMRKMGIKISSTEMLLFELLKSASHPQFRTIAKLIK
jgi:nicotinamidase-related amidase